MPHPPNLNIRVVHVRRGWHLGILTGFATSNGVLQSMRPWRRSVLGGGHLPVLLAVLPAGALALSACAGVTTVRSEGGSTYSAGLYVQSVAQVGTNAVVVRNSPFPPDAVLAALRDHYRGNRYRFALGTPPDWNGYTVLIAFGGPAIGNESLCANPNQPQRSPAGGGVELVAEYCYGNRLVTEVLGRAPALSGPEDPRFRELIGQSVDELFTNESFQDRGTPSGAR